MKTVSTAFKDAQKSPVAVSVRRISYKRRYWVQASNAYTWESSWSVLPENEVISVSPITGKLDTDKLNEFKISNVNLVLKNERRQWKAGKRGGYFGATTAYPDGFEPYWTKFKIESGYEVSGVATYIPLFVGVATGFSTAAASDTIQIDVRGLEALLENANAENVSTLVSYENMGTGNGSNKDFTTAQPGVGIVKNVYLNGTAKKPGTDYSISQLNEATLGAKISFTIAPGSGVAVLITYRYWKQNQKIEDVVDDLLTEAGIPFGYSAIDPVLFVNGITGKHRIDSQSDWAQGTTSDGDVSRVPGSLVIDMGASNNMELLDDFSDGNYTSNPTWTAGGFDATFSVVSNKLRAYISSSEGAIDTPSNGAQVGSWSINLTSKISDFGDTLSFSFGGTTRHMNPSSPYGIQYHNGDRVHVSFGTGDNYGNTMLSLFLNNTLVASTRIADFLGADFPFTLMVQRVPNGTVYVFIDGGLKLQFQSSSWLTPSYIGFGFAYDWASPDREWDIDNVQTPTETLSTEWISQTFDSTAGVTAYGSVVVDKNDSSGMVVISTRTSTNGSTWDAWVNTGPQGQVYSAIKRYIQVRVNMSMSSSSHSEPIINSIQIHYSAITTTISLVNLTGKTVYQAIQDLGGFANYEWGFNESEIFFFRQKQADKNIDETLDSSINVIDVSSLSDGVDRVYSEVQATYGNFDITVGDDGMAKDGPIARYGKRRLTIDGGDILLAPDTDVASGVALSFYAALKKPRQTMKARTKLMEWLDLSDTVSLTFNDNIPARPWFFGDTSAYFGDQTLYFFGDADQTAKGTLCKVVGYRHDTENKTSEFDLEEII